MEAEGERLFWERDEARFTVAFSLMMNVSWIYQKGDRREREKKIWPTRKLCLPKVKQDWLQGLAVSFQFFSDFLFYLTISLSLSLYLQLVPLD